MKKTDLNRLIKLRKALHQFPDLAQGEKHTAQRIIDFFQPLSPQSTLTNIGGEGVAFVYEGAEMGPTSLFRCELDGLPIQEETKLPHTSTIEGRAHACGHDGHMSIIAGLGQILTEKPIAKGRVVLLFQPAEETGEGAAKVIQDPKFATIRPDYAFAMHNLPGHPLHEVVLKKGAFAAASRGIIIHLKGKTSHAAHPEDGNSPAEAMAKIIVGLQAIPESLEKFSLITVIHAKLGNIAFGTAPGQATIMATIRSFDDETMNELVYYAEKLSGLIAKEYQLESEISYTETFKATVNNENAWHYANEAAKKLKLKTKHIRNPFRWSEDFGQFSTITSTMLFGLGSGKKQPQLHRPDFDFPDSLLPTGVKMFDSIIRQIHQ